SHQYWLHDWGQTGDRLPPVLKVGSSLFLVECRANLTGANRDNRGLNFYLYFLCLLLLNLSLLFSRVCSRKNQPANAIRDFHFVKIDEQAEEHIQKFHVAQELRFVNGQDFLNRFGFNKDAALDQQIET